MDVGSSGQSEDAVVNGEDANDTPRLALDLKRHHHLTQERIISGTYPIHHCHSGYI
jgi:hypothetical protein